MQLNINAKPFISKKFLDEKKWYDSKVEEFIKNNKYIFEYDEDIKTIVSLANTPFEKVKGRRLKELTKFHPVLSSIKEINTWADVVTP